MQGGIEFQHALKQLWRHTKLLFELTDKIALGSIRPLREFCVSEFRQTQEYHVFNVHDGGLFPLSTTLPVA